MKKWNYSLAIAGKLQAPDMRLVDTAFAAAKNLALQYV